MSIEDEMIDAGTEFLTSEMNSINPPVLGMEFGSPDEAFQFYKQYSCKMGFGITRRTSHNFYGVKYHVTLACNKNRQPSQKTDGEDSGKCSKRTIGTGCRAKIVLKDHMLTGNWKITEAVLEHNHELQPDCIRLMRCRPEIPLFGKNQLENSKPTEIPCLNFPESEADVLTQFLCRQQVRCPNFFYSVNLDNNGRLVNVFWADARSHSAFKYFGDVIAFDSTYLTNRCRIPLTMFIGANHHGESILLGCALLGNEFKETYVWLFRTFLSCMRKAPNAIVTDECGAISLAVSEVFPQARHSLCLWQIMKKVPEKLAGVEDRDGVMQAVRSCVYDSTNLEDFESNWSELMKNLSPGESYDWFNGLYEMREKWVPVFIKPFFWAGMFMIQLGNQFFDGCINSRTSLRAFLEKYDAELHSKREKEKQEDINPVDLVSKLVSNFHFEKQFAEAYTSKIFFLFQKELHMLIGCSCELVVVKDSYHHYSVSDFSKKTKSIVRYCSITQEYFCDCMLFESAGIVCRHGLCVYRQLFIDVLPDKYVINRWRKDYMRSHLSKAVQLPALCHNNERYEEFNVQVHNMFLEIVELASRGKKLGELLLSSLVDLRSRLLETNEDTVECTNQPAVKDSDLMQSNGHQVKKQKVSSSKKANKIAQQKDDGGMVTNNALSRNSMQP